MITRHSRFGTYSAVLLIACAVGQSRASDDRSLLRAVAPDSEFAYESTPNVDGSRSVHLSGSLQCILAFAYNVGVAQIMVPSSLPQQKYEVTIGSSSTPSNAEIRAKLRELLFRQFRLSVHTEKDIGRIGVLEPAAGLQRGPHTSAIQDEGSLGCETKALGKVITVKCRTATIAAIVDEVSTVFASDLGGWRISDTGDLNDRYDFIIDYHADDVSVHQSTGADLESELQRQLGFRLWLKKSLISMVVVDRIELKADQVRLSGSE